MDPEVVRTALAIALPVVAGGSAGFAVVMWFVGLRAPHVDPRRRQRAWNDAGVRDSHDAAYRGVT